MDLPDRLAALARAQNGLLTIAQCRDAGISPRRVATAYRTGRWTRPQRGVYQTLPGRDDWQTRAVAALLSCGPDAALSHASAARAWGIMGPWSGRGPEQFDILVPWERRVATPNGVRLHRCRAWRLRVAARAWPRRTTAADTVLDLAATADLDATISWVGRALQRETTTEELLLEALDRRGRQRHAAELREILDIGGIESAAELRYHRDVAQRHGLPPARRQVVDARAGSRRVDVEYEEYRLRVEIDGRVGHQGWDERRGDARKDIAAARNRWMSIRPGWRDVAISPCDLAAAVAEILWGRGWRGLPSPCRAADCAIRGVLEKAPRGAA
ncbi:MAG: type IV toxin-antitoxin system AbiEi family antitoxin domain-containing protein [Austwickia sp.]|nr:type IV toxin-antitoxin system AbiEi family antitoxin domain-containing protein [Actinomycetota bacterium]MCB1255059.1 type IV toxin-antitoxin system AbiEi family antitoxin domain-containing protein [Austwickia sp.]MCO5310769.1 type IV toxin-antitoxin system AbiEi family antitoxin domain-containing protein [Austwickia sp.]